MSDQESVTAMDLHDAAMRDNDRLRAEIRALRANVEKLERDIRERDEKLTEWLKQAEERAVAGGHIFLQHPTDDDNVTCCLRCLIYHPDAGQGCVERMRDRAHAAERRIATLEGDNRRLTAENERLEARLEDTWDEARET